MRVMLKPVGDAPYKGNQRKSKLLMQIWVVEEKILLLTTMSYLALSNLYIIPVHDSQKSISSTACSSANKIN